ncbi:hypothetical protein IT418_04365 [bacterium]|nr:hypothetical protein [bacterium]
MKKLYPFLFILILVISFAGSFSQVSAAGSCDADKNTFLNVFKYGDEQIDEGLGTDGQSNIVKTSSYVRNSSIINNYMAILGFVGSCEDRTTAETLEDARTSTGLLFVATGGVTSAFNNAPSENIPGYYANMLLPKEVANTGVYAASCEDFGLLTRGPECPSAGDSWEAFGIADLWGVSFTISMMLVVLVLLVSGFMIMFRSKIGGQTIVTVSMALQNVILSSVMSLASFAIGVFFVNLSKALMFVIATMFATFLWPNLSGGDNWIMRLFGKVAGENFGITYLNDPFGLFAKIILLLMAGDKTYYSPISIFGTSLASGDGVLKSGVEALFNGAVGLVFDAANIVTNGIFGLIALTVRLLIASVILVACLRIWFAVIKTYVDMAIDVVVAPILFIVSAIPSKGTVVKDWLTRMLRNSLTVPIMFAMVNATIYIVLKTAIAGAGEGGILSSPLAGLTGGALPRSTADVLMALISPHAIILIVLLNMVPSIPGVIADIFAGKGSGTLDKVNEATMKQLQKIPLVGSMFS